MLGTISYYTLQQYWWAIIALLAGLLVLLLFVQGGQTLIYSLGKTDKERTLLINSLGRKWEFTFTTLVTFGGAFFASFPLFYSTSFGGAYWVWIIILFAFVIQAISYEFRSKPNNVFGSKTYETFLFVNGAVGTLLLGTAIATFFNGSQFIIDFNNITDPKNPVISQWQNPLRGLEALSNIHNLSLGLSVFFLSRTLGILYFMNNIENENIIKRARKQLVINSLPFCILFIFFLIRLFLMDGYSYNSVNKTVVLENYKYFHNLTEMPFLSILFVSGIALVLFGIGNSVFKVNNKGIWYTGLGVVLTVFCIFLLAGYNNTAYYPSSIDLQSSLTIENSSSSKFTLIVMSYVSLIVPFVFTYIYIAWKSINKKKITFDEIDSESHVY